MKKITFLIVFGALTCLAAYAEDIVVPVSPSLMPAQAAQPQSYALEQALADATANNPTSRAAQNRALAARRQQQAALGSNLLPQLTGDASWGVSQYEVNNQTVTSHPRSTGVTLSQPIFAGGSRLATYNAARAGARASSQTAVLTRQQTLVQTASAYANALATQEETRAAESLVKALSFQTEAAQARLKAGEGTQTDLSLATARLQTARGQLAVSAAAHTNARALLEELTARPLGSPTLVWPELEVLTAQPLAQTVLNHPSYLAATARAQQASAQRKAARGSFLPTVTANAAATDSENSLFGPGGMQQSITLNASMPFFTGGSTFNTYRASAALEQAAQDDLTATAAQLQTQILTAEADYSAAQENLVAARAAASAQSQATAGTELAGRAGEASLLNVLDSRQELAATEASAARARASLVIATYNLLAARGSL